MEWEKGNWIGAPKEIHLRDIEISLEMPKESESANEFILQSPGGSVVDETIDPKSNQKGILHFGFFFWSFLELASFPFNYWERIGFFRFISFTLSFLLSQKPQPMS